MQTITELETEKRRYATNVDISPIALLFNIVWIYYSLGDQLNERDKSLLIQVKKNCDAQKLEAALRSQIEVLTRKHKCLSKPPHD